MAGRSPYDAINRVLSTPTLKGFIEVPVDTRRGSSSALINVATIARIEPYLALDEDNISQTQTFIELLSHSAPGISRTMIASLSYQEVKALLLAAQ